MKKWFAGIAAIILVVALCGCSLIKGDSTAAPENTKEQAEEQAKETADMETAEENNTPDEAPKVDNTGEEEPETKEETVELVNLRGDIITVVKQADGTYSDGIETYRFDGAETWTDGKGVEWNETVKLSEADEETVELVNLRGDIITVIKQADGTYSDGTETYYYDGAETWTDSRGVEWNETVKTEE